MSNAVQSGRRGLTIAVTSGKGGVGKTTLTVNLAIALARLDTRVGILDADFGLGNVDVMLGLSPDAHLGSVLTGEKALRDIEATTAWGVRVFPAGTGIRGMAALPNDHWARVQAGIDQLGPTFDYLLVDTGPGISDTSLMVANATDKAIVVTTCDPTAVVDAYATTKLLIGAAPGREVGLVVNMARDAAQGRAVAQKLGAAVQQFLGGTIRYYGHVERDPRVSDSVQSQNPLMTQSVDSPATRAYQRLARRIALWTPPLEAAAPAVQCSVMTPEDFARTEARSCA